MKNKKRLIARVGAVIAVVLMVGALAAPCFADYPPHVTPTAPPVPMIDVYNSVYNHLIGIDKVSAITQKYCSVYSIDLLVDYFVLNGGNLLYNTGIPISSLTLDNVTLTTVNYGTYYFYMNFNGFETDPYLIQADVDVQYQGSYNDGTVFIVQVYDNNTGVVYLELEYEGLIYDDGDGHKYTNLYFQTGFVHLGVNNYSLTRNNIDDLYVGYVGTVPNVTQSLMDMLFFGVNSPLFCPYDLYTGFLEGAIEYNSSGWNAGFDDGFKMGYDYIADSDPYNQGYQDALDDIDSGAFGRNLLGQSFIAPFKAVTDLTLVQWQNQDGTIITITVGAILSAFVGISLFIWFLKMFAGG